MAQAKFETSLSRLESIVSELEKGDLPLEEALKFFEDGIRLSKGCLKMLDEAERKVEVLLKTKDGKKKAVPFEVGDKVGDPSQDLF